MVGAEGSDDYVWVCAQHPKPELASCDAPEEEMEEDEAWPAADDEGEGGDADEEMLVLEAQAVEGQQ